MAFMRFSPDPPHECWLEKHSCPYKRRKGIQGGGTAPCIPKLSLHVQRISFKWCFRAHDGIRLIKWVAFFGATSRESGARTALLGSPDESCFGVDGSESDQTETGCSHS